MDIKLKSFSSSLVTNIGLLAPALLIAATAGVWFASGSIKSAAASIRTAQDKSTQKVSIQKTPITDAEALSAAQRLSKLAPSAVVAVSGRHVVISITNAEQFAEWIHALTEVQSLNKDAQWEVDDMCIASCDGGEPAKAYVTAYTRRLKVD